jgi:hypothetical protein
LTHINVSVVDVYQHKRVLIDMTEELNLGRVSDGVEYVRPARAVRSDRFILRRCESELLCPGLADLTYKGP